MSGNGPAPQREAVLIEHLWEFKNIPPSEGRAYIGVEVSALYQRTARSRSCTTSGRTPGSCAIWLRIRHSQGVLAEMRSRCDALVAEANRGARVGPPFGLTVETIRKPELTVIQDPQPEYGWLVPVEAGLQKGVSDSGRLLG
ncbi:MAG: hypothetical protein ACOX52_17705 [Verrucomicrobiota bacterium]